jgi:hypothetical protein
MIQEQIQNFIKTRSEQKLQDALLEFGRETGIYSVRYFFKDQTPACIGSCRNKAYMPGDFYRVDVWRIPQQKGKFKYEGVFLSRPEAMKEKLGDNNVNKIYRHPAAKFIMSLCKGDVIELSGKSGKELCRISGFSTTQNKIDIRPIYASNTIAEWIKETHIKLTSSFWPADCEGQYFKSINMVFTEYQIKLINITVDGRLFYRL